MSATLDESGSDFVAAAYVRLRPDGAGGYAPGEVQPWVAAATDPARTGTTIEEHPDASANVVAWSKLSRAEFWERTGLRFPEGRLYEDQIVAQRMYAQARRFDVVPDVVAQWRVRADGTSITQREAQLEVLRDCLTAMDGGLRVLESSGHPRRRAGTSPADPLDGPAPARRDRAHPPRGRVPARARRVRPIGVGPRRQRPRPVGHLRGGRRRRRAPVVRRQPRPATRFTTVARMTAPNR